MGGLVSRISWAMPSEANVRRTADDAESSIVQIANRLDKAGATLSQVRQPCQPARNASHIHPQLGIQFIQIGTNLVAREFLEKLDNDLKEKHKIRVRSLQTSGVSISAC